MAIDLGNSELKWGVFDQERLVRTGREVTRRLLTPRAVDQWIRRQSWPSCDAVIIASVVPIVGRMLAARLRHAGYATRVIRGTADVPMRVRYRSPRTLGTDRLVSAYAARARYGAPVIIVSDGTAVTVDAVSASGAYEGGVILPGATLMAKALSEGTAQLPLVSWAPSTQVIGRTTKACIQRGIFFSLVGAVSHVLREMAKTVFPRGQGPVVATGGHARILAPLIPAIRHVDPYLTLRGLSLLARTTQI